MTQWSGEMNDQDYTEITHLRRLLKAEQVRTQQLEKQVALFERIISVKKSRTFTDYLEDDDYAPARK